MAYHNTPVTFDPNLGLCVTPGVPLNIGFNASPLTRVIQVASSRSLASTDNGMHLECTATVTLTVPTGLPAGFRCDVIPNGTTSIAASGTLLNGAGTTLTRAAATAANTIVTIAQRGSVATSYVVTGS